MLDLLQGRQMSLLINLFIIYYMIYYIYIGLQETARGNLAILTNGLGLVYNRKRICVL